MNGWTGTSVWSAAGGMFVSNGIGVAWAPFKAQTSDYAVEGEMQFTKGWSRESSALAVTSRGDTSADATKFYIGGIMTQVAAFQPRAVAALVDSSATFTRIVRNLCRRISHLVAIGTVTDLKRKARA
jgi:hypothetical protein